MPPPLALALTALLVLAYLWYDSRSGGDRSFALWIPTLWISILGSRSVSQWLNLGAPIEISANALHEGSPVDRAVSFVLIVLGFLILFRRRVAWRAVFRNNLSLTLFFLYCAVSVAWSDFPEVALKRWGKGLGDPVMALILLTSADPIKAIETVMRRCAVLLIPASITVIKYYGDYGRGYDAWSGKTIYVGVTTNKNMLGYLLFIFGLFFVSALLSPFGRTRNASKACNLSIVALFLGMIGWLFQMSDSKTPLVSLIPAVAIMIALRIEAVRRHWGAYFVTAIVVIATLEIGFGLSELLITSAGRNMTLTGRTELWHSVIAMSVNPWVGSGFESFWLGDRLQALWQEYSFRPIQAHNGYLETYLNLGWIGVILFGALVVESFVKIRRRLIGPAPRERQTIEQAFAAFAMAYLFSFLLYNISEATIQALNILFDFFLMAVIEYPAAQARSGITVLPRPGTGDHFRAQRRPAVGRPADGQVPRSTGTLGQLRRRARSFSSVLRLNPISTCI